MINVTKTFLPPMEKYQKYLKQIWETNQIANGGKLWYKLKEITTTLIASQKL